ncbi:MAG: hypothetical protein Q4C80_04070 [Bacillota bacterium]|nr:hypothetical protein [Bacillota bacterium]
MNAITRSGLQYMQAKEILSYYGIKPQVVKTIEELAELTIELSCYVNNGGSEACIEEEIADVYVMLMQMELWLDGEGIEEIVSEKLHRQCIRIDEERVQKENAQRERERIERETSEPKYCDCEVKIEDIDDLLPIGEEQK